MKKAPATATANPATEENKEKLGQAISDLQPSTLLSKNEAVLVKPSARCDEESTGPETSLFWNYFQNGGDKSELQRLAEIADVGTGCKVWLVND